MRRSYLAYIVHMNTEQSPKQKNQAVIAAWVCILIACSIALIPAIPTFLIWVIFAFVGVVLSIVVMVTKSAINGVFILVAAVFLPILSSLLSSALFVAVVASEVRRPHSYVSSNHYPDPEPLKKNDSKSTQSPIVLPPLFTVDGNREGASIDYSVLRKEIANKLGGQSDDTYIAPHLGDPTFTVKPGESDMQFLAAYNKLSHFVYRRGKIILLGRFNENIFEFQKICPTPRTLLGTSSTYVYWSSLKLDYAMQYEANRILASARRIGNYSTTSQESNDVNIDQVDVSLAMPQIPSKYLAVNIKHIKIKSIHVSNDEVIAVFWSMSYEGLSGREYPLFHTTYDTTTHKEMRTIELAKELTNLHKVRYANASYALIKRSKQDYIVSIKDGSIIKPEITRYDGLLSSEGLLYYGTARQVKNRIDIIVAKKDGAILSKKSGYRYELKARTIEAGAVGPIPEEIIFHPSTWSSDNIVWSNSQFYIYQNGSSGYVIDSVSQKVLTYYTKASFVGATVSEDGLILCLVESRNPRMMFYKIK